MSDMLVSKAIGGPRDGIKLTAPLSWDGKVELPSKNHPRENPKFYPGRYVWEFAKWRWHATSPWVPDRNTGSPRASKA